MKRDQQTVYQMSEKLMKRDRESTYSYLSLAFRHFTDRLPGGCAGEMAVELDGILDQAAHDLSEETKDEECSETTMPRR